MTPLVPILDLTQQYQSLKTSLDEAVLRVLQSGQFILGPDVHAFEQEMATWLDAHKPPDVITCANGSDALYLALKALNIGPGDEVITTPFTYIATSESIIRAGATPVFVDVEENTFNLDVSKLDEALTSRTKAIMPVHLFGLPANMPKLMTFAKTHNLRVIEDCAQAIGATVDMGQGPVPVGLIGDIACFSFFPSKNLGAAGDGGMLVTQDPHLAEILRMLRVHGSKIRYQHELNGINSRLDSLQAAILRVKLPYLVGWNQARMEVAECYRDKLQALSSELMLPSKPQEGFSHVYHQFTLRCLTGNRSALLSGLQAKGIQTMIYYPIPAYLQPSHASLSLRAENFPVCERLSQQVFSLPIYPELTTTDICRVVDALKEHATPTLSRNVVDF